MHIRENGDEKNTGSHKKRVFHKVRVQEKNAGGYDGCCMESPQPESYLHFSSTR